MSDVEQQQARQILLDSLYFGDGRQDHEHPMHGLYTGLVAGRQEDEQAQD